MSARKYQPKACPMCGVEFVPKRSSQKYCTRVCCEAAKPKKYVPRFSDEELAEAAKAAVAALDEVQRLRLKALLATGRAWREMDEEVLV